MPTYRVIGKSTVKAAGKYHGPGEKVAMQAKDGDPLCEGDDPVLERLKGSAAKEAPAPAEAEAPAPKAKKTAAKKRGSK